MSSSAVRAPTYMMFLNNCRCRGSVYSRLQISVRGMPSTVMSSRNLERGKALVESYTRYPPASISAISRSQVCGFIATINSQPPRRPSQPASETRISYHVGIPWMFDGKILRGATGTPMRMMERANSSLADAEPEPLTLANLITKSLQLCIDLVSLMSFSPPSRLRRIAGRTSACPRRRSGTVRRTCRNASKRFHL